MFRRSFTTTARLLRKANDKPPAGRPNVPRPPGSDDKPIAQETPQKEESDKPSPGLRESLRGSLDPRSEHFILAFANSKLSEKQRTHNLRAVTVAVIFAWATDTWLMPWNDDTYFTSEEENLANFVRYIRGLT
jgi:hypothetical protein